MRPDDLWIIGPGTTTYALKEHLGIGGTLLGVDVVRDRELVDADASEGRLLALLNGSPRPAEPGSS